MKDFRNARSYLEEQYSVKSVFIHLPDKKKASVTGGIGERIYGHPVFDHPEP